MDDDERHARACAKQWACKLAAYAFATKLMPMPGTAKEWRDRRDGFIESHWREFLYWAKDEL